MFIHEIVLECNSEHGREVHEVVSHGVGAEFLALSFGLILQRQQVDGLTAVSRGLLQERTERRKVTLRDVSDGLITDEFDKAIS